eukprot:7161845-Prymnesium_polylepis.1
MAAPIGTLHASSPTATAATECERTPALERLIRMAIMSSMQQHVIATPTETRLAAEEAVATTAPSTRPWTNHAPSRSTTLVALIDSSHAPIDAAGG